MIRDTLLLFMRAFCGLLAWTCLAPLRFFIPRRHDWVAVLGRGDGAFADNCKYFFIDAQSDSTWHVVYVTGHGPVIDALQAAGTPVLRYPGLRAAWFLLRSGNAIVDTSEWSKRWRRELLAGSRIVQLWHGVGFKRIELDRWWHERSSDAAFRLRKFLYRLSGRLVCYDTVLATSEFYARELFGRAFLAKRVLVANYPRNTFGASDSPAATLCNFGVDMLALARIMEWKRTKMAVLVLTPTFRDDGRHCLPMTDEERDVITGFCVARGIRLVVKLHPNDRSDIKLSSDVASICAPRSDIYPLLRHADAMVTDYSSIYMDFLVLDRPILFFVPDMETYLAHRSLQFDYDAMTPGPKSMTWTSLLEEIDSQLTNDTFAAQRRALRRQAFDSNDPATATAALLEQLRARNHA